MYSVISRNLDFSKGHQGITGDKEGQQRRIRQQRLISIGKWIADNQPRYAHGFLLHSFYRFVSTHRHVPHVYF